MLSLQDLVDKEVTNIGPSTDFAFFRSFTPLPVLCDGNKCCKKAFSSTIVSKKDVNKTNNSFSKVQSKENLSKPHLIHSEKYYN